MGADLQHVQDDLRILQIVLIPPVVKGLACARERDRGHKPQLKARLKESIGKRPDGSSR